METKRVYVTEKHISNKLGCGDPRNCMIANAMHDAGFPVVLVDTTTDIGDVEDLEMPKSLLDRMIQYDCDEHQDPVPFRFDVFMEDGKAVKIGEAVDTVEEDCSDLISDIEAMLSSEFQKEVAL